jgi:hypothetical protein
VIVPYCAGSRLPNMSWFIPWSIRIFIQTTLQKIQKGGGFSQTPDMRHFGA